MIFRSITAYSLGCSIERPYPMYRKWIDFLQARSLQALGTFLHINIFWIGCRFKAGISICSKLTGPMDFHLWLQICMLTCLVVFLHASSIKHVFMQPWLLAGMPTFLFIYQCMPAMHALLNSRYAYLEDFTSYPLGWGWSQRIRGVDRKKVKLLSSHCYKKQKEYADRTDILRSHLNP